MKDPLAPEAAKTFIARKQQQFQGDLDKERSIAMKDIGRRGTHRWLREAWTLMEQRNHKEKVFVVERLRSLERRGERAASGGAKPGDVEYRLGYFIVGKRGNRRGRWTWGRAAEVLTILDKTAAGRNETAEAAVG